MAKNTAALFKDLEEASSSRQKTVMGVMIASVGVLMTAILGGGYMIKSKPISADEIATATAADTGKLIDEKLGGFYTKLTIAREEKSLAPGGKASSSSGAVTVPVTYEIEAADIEAVIKSDKTRDKRFINLLQTSHDRKMSEMRRCKSTAAEMHKVETDFQDTIHKARMLHLDRRINNRQELLDAIEELKAPSL